MNKHYSIIKKNSVQSTNSYLKNISQEKTISDFTIVIANEQTEGRGQLGNSWQSEKNKNINMSVYKCFCDLEVNYNFYISIAVSLSLYEAFKSYSIKDVKIKWPNDIYVKNKKIAGVLIESSVNRGKITSAIIGIGINVNQKEFKNLPQANSLCNILNKELDLESLFFILTSKLEITLLDIYNKEFKKLKHSFESNLYRKDVLSKFKFNDIMEQNGIIKGINKIGQLKVKFGDTIKTFNSKEIGLLVDK